MTLLEVIILAVVQAVTEFVPVSSSGHLIATQEVGGIESVLGLDVMLHFGTLLALIFYFREELRGYWYALLGHGSKHTVINLIISTIPAALVGFTLKDLFEDDVRSLGVVIIMLTVVGMLMIGSDKLFSATKRSSIKKMTRSQALLIGLGQAIALIPGTSRSGITMLSSQSQGLNNEQSARYSFLMGIPIIFGASVNVLFDQSTRTYIENNLMPTFIGVVIAAVTGWFVLKRLIPFVSTHGLAVFGWYRLALASILFIIWIN